MQISTICLQLQGPELWYAVCNISYSNYVTGLKIGPALRAKGFSYMYIVKHLKFLLWNPKVKSLDIWHETPFSGPLPWLFKLLSSGQNWSTLGVMGFPYVNIKFLGNNTNDKIENIKTLGLIKNARTLEGSSIVLIKIIVRTGRIKILKYLLIKDVFTE